MRQGTLLALLAAIPKSPNSSSKVVGDLWESYLSLIDSGLKERL